LPCIENKPVYDKFIRNGLRLQHIASAGLGTLDGSGGHCLDLINNKRFFNDSFEILNLFTVLNSIVFLFLVVEAGLNYYARLEYLGFRKDFTECKGAEEEPPDL